MDKKTEALKLALEALKKSRDRIVEQGGSGWKLHAQQCVNAITAIREALAEQETVLPGGGHVPAVPVAVYGYCPECGGAGVMRERRPNGDDKCTNGHKYPSSKALAEQPAQQEPIHVPVTDNTYNYAKSLAEAIFKQHFASDEHYASGRIVWGVSDTVIGILTQIDNMVADMVRKPAQQEPVAWIDEYGNAFPLAAKQYSVVGKHWKPLYTSPPAQRKPLTDEEIESINVRLAGNRDLARLFARAIEAAHGITGEKK